MWTHVHTWIIINVWAVQEGPPTDSGGMIKPRSFAESLKKALAGGPAAYQTLLRVRVRSTSKGR